MNKSDQDRSTTDSPAFGTIPIEIRSPAATVALCVLSVTGTLVTEPLAVMALFTPLTLTVQTIVPEPDEIEIDAHNLLRTPATGMANCTRISDAAPVAIP